MDFIQTIKDKAKANLQTIVLPETEDLRILQAAHIVLKEEIAKIILIGDEKAIKERGNGLDLSKATFY